MEKIIIELKSNKKKLMNFYSINKKKQLKIINELENVLGEQNEIKIEIEKITHTIRILENKDGLVEYNKKWGWGRKVIHVIRSKKRFITQKDILLSLILFETGETFLEDKNDRRIYIAMKVNLKRLSDSEEVVKYVYGNSDKIITYGFSDWLDSNGEPEMIYNYETTPYYE